jgi:hypothetical protein
MLLSRKNDADEKRYLWPPPPENPPNEPPPLRGAKPEPPRPSSMQDLITARRIRMRINSLMTVPQPMRPPLALTGPASLR